MKTRPILFSAPMVRALLAGQKTQTRRVVKDRIYGDHTYYACLTGDCPHTTQRECDDAMRSECPYGVPGDLLWVRETFLTDRRNKPRWPQPQEIIFDATPEWALDHEGNLVRVGGGAASADKTPTSPEEARWSIDAHPMWFKRPGIHMPRWASRLTLRITDVRVQPLKDIDGLDAIAEGITRGEGVAPWRTYMRLWNEINGEGAWQKNPWVWALTFEVIKQNVDAVLASRAAT